MKILLFVEGQTEQRALPAFLQRWLDKRVSQRVGIKVVNFKGVHHYLDDIKTKVQLYFEGDDRQDFLGGLGLVDLYGFPDLPAPSSPVKERYSQAKAALKNASAMTDSSSTLRFTRPKPGC